MNEFAPQDSSNKPDQPEIQFPETSYADKTATAENSPGEKSYKWLIKGGLVVLAIAFFFGMKMYNKASASADVKKQMYEVCAEYPDQARMHALIDKLHDRCFEECYKMGGRRSSAKFDDERYVKMMMNAITKELGVAGGAPEVLEADEVEVVEEVNDPHAEAAAATTEASTPAGESE